MAREVFCGPRRNGAHNSYCAIHGHTSVSGVRQPRPVRRVRDCHIRQVLVGPARVDRRQEVLGMIYPSEKQSKHARRCECAASIGPSVILGPAGDVHITHTAFRLHENCIEMGMRQIEAPHISHVSWYAYYRKPQKSTIRLGAPETVVRHSGLLHFA